ncbi:hypothetical protein RHECIAT_CH0003830 [Rhizobium etli CIAT 652]|uniref:Uncharacterized protein n=1 Tax=Rhizobium etli (strain CIAT 652) TaxID=491916 RepID=B3PZW8_RHIE6|nr:hypothetical protein RHECIAT_CH0003830 [Rhizobium etli CIAT 652]
MTKPERKIINSLKISEISAVDRPAQAHAVATIMKSAAPIIAQPVTCSPTPEGNAALLKMLAAIRGEPITKSRSEESRTMSNETHYERLTKSYAQRHGVSIQKAAEKLMRDDPDAVRDAYDADENREVARRFAEASRN